MTEQRKSADTRPPVFDAEDDKSVLLSFLNYQRTSIAAKVHGAPEPSARTAGVPSGTSLLGLIKHLTAAEIIWFEWSFAGADVAFPDLSMKVDGDESAARILADYQAAVARADAVIEAAPDLSASAARGMGPDQERHTLRWILAHMIGETARHAGHADILREELDGSTGR